MSQLTKKDTKKITEHIGLLKKKVKKCHKELSQILLYVCVFCDHIHTCTHTLTQFCTNAHTQALIEVANFMIGNIEVTV